MNVRCRAVLAGAFLAAAMAGGSPPLHAQEVNDSLRDEVRLRLERLERRLGDSTNLILQDSLNQPAGPFVAGEDSTLQVLLALPGYDAIRYRAETALFETGSRILTLTGSEAKEAGLNRQGLELVADSALIFDENTGRLVTMGQEATYRPEQGDEVLTRRIIFDLNEDRGTAEDARTQMNAGMGDWIVRGDFPWVNPDVSFGHDIMFTSCEEEEPHYHFVAGEIKIQPGGTLVARNVRLRFGDVTVFWLPFIAQSTETGRRSGLLPIRFSVNDIVRTSGTYSRRISNLGYYWAMSDYSDAQVAMDWWSGNYAAVTGAARYNWLRQFLDGGANFRYFWRADGGSELAFDTNHSWSISERMQARLSARYASSSEFVRRNSLDPREVTQSIDSDAGLNRRFDWGNLSVSANRRQFLSDDRTEMTLPTANLSLSTITLFRAPPNRSRIYNNMTLSASGRVARSIRNLPEQDLAANAFSLSAADTENLRGGLSVTLSAGAFSIAQSADLNRDITRAVPAGFFSPEISMARAGVGSVGDLMRPAFFPRVVEASDFNADEVTWATSVNYQQNLVGSTTITPRLSISGRSIRSDTSTVNEGGFVSAPSRISFGAQLKSDIYGFYAGDKVRHKLSPSFEYAYSPETAPTALQAATFGSRAVQPKNEIRFSLTQTLEARVEDEAADSAAAVQEEATPAGEPRRLPNQQKITWLALRTSAVTYDFEQASQQGHFTRGFADNLRISHQISSDYLRGLSASIEHGVFDDAEAAGARQFSPFLSSVNLSFSLNNRSALFRWLGGGGEDDGAEAAEEEASAAEEETTDPTGLETADLGDATIVPGFSDRDRDAERQQSSQGNVGSWDASFSYSLARSQSSSAAANQMLQATLRFQPTEKWSVNWRTSYDLAARAFNDHIISLTRDLHRWEADFSFHQTAAGNWSFSLEVALSDNRDLHFDYEQRAAGGLR